MTISSATSKSQYTGNGSATVFAWNFLIPAAENLKVYLNEVLQSSGYTATGFNNPAGGSVTFTTAPATGVVISLVREMPLTQVVDYIPYDAFPAETHEGALDKLTMITQQLQEQVDRALKLPVDSTSASIEIVNPVDNALVEFDLSTPNVTKLTSGPTAAEIQADVDAAAASAASAASSASSAAAAASDAAASAAAAEEAANNIAASKYEEVVAGSPKSVFTLPFQISAVEENLAIYVNGVAQPMTAFAITNSTTITMVEALPVGTTFMLASVNPAALPDLGDYLKLVPPTTKPATVGETVIYGGSGLWYPQSVRRRNKIHNGDFEVWQRGSTFNNAQANQVTADRFRLQKSNAAVVNVIATANSAYLGNHFSRLCLAHVTATPDTVMDTADFHFMSYNIEGFDMADMFSRNMVLSFWVFATTPGIYSVIFRNTDNTRTYAAEYTVNASLVWEKKTINFQMNNGSSGGQWDVGSGRGLQIGWAMACGATYRAPSTGSWLAGNYVAGPNQINSLATASNFFLADIQLELGTVATEFEVLPFAERLATLQRYYEKSYDIGVAPGTVTTVGAAVFSVANAAFYNTVPFAVGKRASVLPTLWNPETGASNSIRNGTTGANVTPDSLVPSPSNCMIRATFAATGQLAIAHYTADAELS